MENKLDYKKKKVFITGHTGFKGSWLCKVLLELGADVCGYSLEPDEDKILYGISGVEKHIYSIYDDIRNLEKIERSMKEFAPDIVIHMAAQPIVREGYKKPVDTYSTNVMGTVNVLEAVRQCESVQSVINVTTDKVYQNNEWKRGYVESDVLNGFDPYSNSKSCSELVTDSYVRSFLRDKNIAVSTCRAGNVLGGGDFAKDRIIPDCYRAMSNKKSIIVRNPHSVRPYQHVLDPLYAYLLIAKRQYDDINISSAYNIGPNDKDNIDTGSLVQLFCDKWGENANWEVHMECDAPHEANYLYLDCTKVKHILKWNPVWSIEQTMDATVEWYKRYMNGENVAMCMEKQIGSFMESGGNI